MSLLGLFQWFDATPISKVIRDSTYIFPVVEVFHLFGLTLMLGIISVIALRTLGFGMKKQTVQELAIQLAPWSVWGGIVTIVSGILLFLSEAMKCYTNAAFPYKMWFLVAGVILYLLTHRKMVKGRLSEGQLKFVAILTLVLWYGVAIAGRAIAFV